MGEMKVLMLHIKWHNIGRQTVIKDGCSKPQSHQFTKRRRKSVFTQLCSCRRSGGFLAALRPYLANCKKKNLSICSTVGFCGLRCPSYLFDIISSHSSYCFLCSRHPGLCCFLSPSSVLLTQGLCTCCFPLAADFFNTELQGLLRKCHLINKVLPVDHSTKTTAPHPTPISLSCFISSIDLSSSVILFICMLIACLLPPTTILDPQKTLPRDYELFLSKGRHFSMPLSSSSLCPKWCL